MLYCVWNGLSNKFKGFEKPGATMNWLGINAERFWESLLLPLPPAKVEP